MGRKQALRRAKKALPVVPPEVTAARAEVNRSITRIHVRLLDPIDKDVELVRKVIKAGAKEDTFDREFMESSYKLDSVFHNNIVYVKEQINGMDDPKLVAKLQELVNRFATIKNKLPSQYQAMMTDVTEPVPEPPSLSDDLLNQPAEILQLDPAKRKFVMHELIYPLLFVDGKFEAPRLSCLLDESVRPFLYLDGGAFDATRVSTLLDECSRRGKTVVLEKLARRVCANCDRRAFITETHYRICSGCVNMFGPSRARYCSKACQRADWIAGHKDDCPSVNATAASGRGFIND